MLQWYLRLTPVLTQFTLTVHENNLWAKEVWEIGECKSLSELNQLVSADSWQNTMLPGHFEMTPQGVQNWNFKLLPQTTPRIPIQQSLLLCGGRQKPVVQLADCRLIWPINLIVLQTVNLYGLWKIRERIVRFDVMYLHVPLASAEMSLRVKCSGKHLFKRTDSIFKAIKLPFWSSFCRCHLILYSRCIKTLWKPSVYTSQNVHVCLCYYLICWELLKCQDSAAALLNPRADTMTSVGSESWSMLLFLSIKVWANMSHSKNLDQIGQISCSDVC